MLYSAVKLFHITKYLTHPYTTLLLRILLTSHFFSPSTSIRFGSFTFCLFTSFLYFTTLLIFTIGWIFIKTGNLSLTILVDTTFSIVYSFTYYFVSFLASFFSPLCSVSLYYSFSMLLFPFASYLLATSFSLGLSSMLLLSLAVSFLFFPQTLLLSLPFSFFWYLLLFVILSHSFL